MVAGDEDHPALVTDSAIENDIERELHKLIRKAGEDIESMKFNTAIAAMMEFVNGVYKAGRISRSQAKRFVLVLSPFAPHIAEELWEKLGHGQSLAYEPWSVANTSYLVQDSIEIPVQINGKLRGRVNVPATAAQADIEVTAKNDPMIATHLAGKTIRKVIYVPGRLLNIVA
jgi:leucyl-tRNA synthetase